MNEHLLPGDASPDDSPRHDAGGLESAERDSRDGHDRGFDAPRGDSGRGDPENGDAGGFGAGVEAAAAGTSGRRGKKKSSAGRRRKKAARKDDAPRDAGADGTAPSSDDGGSADGDRRKKKRRRRGKRGGRGRKRSRSADEAAAAEALPGEEDDLELLLEADGGKGGASGKKKRRRRRKKTADAAEDAPGGEGKSSRGRKAKKKSKKKAKKKRSRRRKSDDAEEATEDAEDGGGGRKKSSRRKKAAKTPEELAAEEEALRTQTILVNAVEPEERRVVVVEDGRIVDLLMTAESQKTLVNDIYRGKVVNLEPAIGAAFVDFGQGRNGFLHTSDVLAAYGEKGFRLEHLLTARDDGTDDDEIDAVDDGDDEKSDGGKKGKGGRSRKKRRGGRERRPITELLRVGDPVAVQITKDAIGDKGPTLTTYLSIPGRYLVLMPSMTRTGVSRKIPDEKERRRLKRILGSLGVPPDMGVIVRTAGVGQTKTELKRDLEYLLGVWESFGKKLKQSRGPSPLYLESDVATRTLRDLFDQRTKEVVVDDYTVHEQMVEFARQLLPEHVERILPHDGDRPLFHHFGIEQDFERVFSRRVELPSGGSIVFDQAEALVAIDVNSGRTRADGFDFEAIALKTNLEAVPEIARQIRLRDLGGILVVDFIDMMKSSSNRQVERALRAELSGDRARSKLGRVSQFGLLEMTRQRLGPGTHKKVFQPCPRCRGTGRVRTVESRAQAILRRLGSALVQKGFSTVEVRAHPEVIDYLQEDLYDWVRAMEHRTDRELRFVSVPEQPEDSVLRYLRSDGREVRPGGRRKR